MYTNFNNSIPYYQNYGRSNRLNNDRYGFLGPFILGGITGGLIAPAFYRPYYPYQYPYYYRPY